MHELCVYFPNGPRRQPWRFTCKTDRNRRFKFRHPLHEAVRECFPRCAEFSWDDREVSILHLAGSMRSPRRRFALTSAEAPQEYCGANPCLSPIYAIAGSFVQFLINHGMTSSVLFSYERPRSLNARPDRRTDRGNGLSLTELTALEVADHRHAPRPACHSRAEWRQEAQLAPGTVKKLRKGEVHDRNQSKADLGAAGERKKGR